MRVQTKLGMGSRLYLALGVLALVLLGALWWGASRALAASPSPAASPTSTGQVVLKLGWTEEPDNLNPFIGYNGTDWEIWALNYDYLFRCGDNNQPTLDLASVFPTEQNGGISAGGTVWTIHIRGGVKFQDGTPLTAADVAFTYDYVIKNDIGQYTTYIAGVKTVTALNPTTVRFTCAHPMATNYMEMQSVPVLPEHIWKNVSPNAATTSYENKSPIVGSGPFQTVARVKGSYVEMVRNPTYWGQKPTVAKIYFEAYQNADTMVADLRSGKIDGIWGDIPEGEFTTLKSVPGVKAVAFPYYSWDYLEFNCYDKPSSMGNPVLRDPEFRLALNYALDRQRLCNLAYGGLAQPGTTIINPTTWSNPDFHWQPPADQAYTFNLAKAGQLLSAAGYPLKNGVRLNKQGNPIVLRLEATTDFTQGQAAAKLITGWLEQLGLKIKFSVVDSGALESDMYNYHGGKWEPNFDLVVSGWTGYYDPGETLDCLITQQIGNLNEPFWSDAEYDKLAVEQASTVDPQQRQALIWQMQQIMYRQSPWIVLDYPDVLEAFNTARWTGWTRQHGGRGGAWELEGNIASYLNLRPRAAVTTTSGGSNGALVVVTVVAALAAGAVVFFLLRRRVRHVEDET